MDKGKKQSGGTMDSMSVPRGTIKTSYGRDNSSHSLPNTKGKSMGGGVDNLGHSLSGASAVQRPNG